jgi:hypothetical protein
MCFMLTVENNLDGKHSYTSPDTSGRYKRYSGQMRPSYMQIV